MLNGLQNFLQLINDNWTTIIVIISLIFALFKKIQSYLSKSNDEKIAIVKNQVQQTILKLITDAEMDYKDWAKTGSIKRSQVIQKIFEDYPILSKISDQKYVINWIDEMICDALKTLREITAKNQETNDNVDETSK